MCQKVTPMSDGSKRNFEPKPQWALYFGAQLTGVGQYIYHRSTLSRMENWHDNIDTRLASYAMHILEEYALDWRR
jgi:hypothetical protein